MPEHVFINEHSASSNTEAGLSKMLLGSLSEGTDKPSYSLNSFALFSPCFTWLVGVNNAIYILSLVVVAWSLVGSMSRVITAQRERRVLPHS